MDQQTGRNGPCPCGSGRKFKHCCVAGSARARAQERYRAGIELQRRGQAALAAIAYQEALGFDPRLAEALVNLGNALRTLGRLEESLACHQRALVLRPDFFAGLHTNIGLTLHRLHRYEEAIVSFEAARTHAGQSVELLVNLSGPLWALGRKTAAATCLREAAALDDRRVETQLGLGNALLDMGRVADAIPVLRRALALEPANSQAHASLLMALLYRGDPPDMEEYRARALDYGRRLDAGVAAQRSPHLNSRDPERRLRIGYVSADLRSHPVAAFLEPVLRCHDRGSFEVHCFSTGATADAVTARLRALGHPWHEAAALDDEQLAQRVRRAGIDVLVDLSGWTAGGRMPVFACKPAPLQLAWIGFPGQTGLTSIDYRLSDPIASPAAAAPSRAGTRGPEEDVALPKIFCSYRPPADAPEPVPAPTERATHATFGSFNNCAKISDVVVRTWSQLLAASDVGDRLVLKDRNFADAGVCEWVRGRFAAHGADATRVELIARLPTETDHLAAYGKVDVALDTFPYCGVTTTCEALWMGVPVVSLAGDTFVGRMGATLLAAAGHPEWVASEPAGYVRTALALAADRAGRARMRTRLRDDLRAGALLDEAGVTRELEACIRTLWRRWCAGLERGAR